MKTTIYNLIGSAGIDSKKVFFVGKTGIALTVENMSFVEKKNE